MSLATVAPLKRLTRPDQLPSFSFTVRDLGILHFVATNRCAIPEQVAAYIGASVPKTRRRLYLLWANGLLERPRQQAVYAAAFADHGNRPLIYSLSRKGLRVLADHQMVVDPRLSATIANNARATAPFYTHTIETTEVMLGFRGHLPDAPRLVDEPELLTLLPDETRAARHPFRLSVSITQELKPITLRVRPDRLFGLYANDGARFYALELDRSTSVVFPRSKNLSLKSSIAKKLVCYFHAHQEGIPTTQWGLRSFRVLFVTDSETRVQHFIAAQRELTRDRLLGLFLYTTKARLAAGGPFAPVWRSATADGLSLLPTPSKDTGDA